MTMLGLIALSTVIDYNAGLGIERWPARKKLFLWLSICSNLGMLSIFKYADFFIDQFSLLLGLVGFEAHHTSLQIILPIGISFYTFQTMSYTIDVYRGELKAERNFLHFALFVSYFPQLVAGPIERAGVLLPQFKSISRATVEQLKQGAYLFVWGMTQKVIISDYMCADIDDRFLYPTRFEPAELFASVIMLSIRIYYDFAGYSNIARGTSLFFGVSLKRNFREPFLATNLRQLWRDWHVSLSDWLRDYLFIPLGGSRVAVWRICLNFLITMTLCGLWHGAAITMVLWGFLNGLFSVFHLLYRRVVPRDQPLGLFVKPLSQLVAYMQFSLFLVIFASPTITSAFEYYAHMAVVSNWTHQASVLLLPLCLYAAIQFYDYCVRRFDTEFFVLRLPAPVYTTIILAGLGINVLLIASAKAPKQFLYFQF